MLDAIDARAAKISRSRTALFRIGQITAVLAGGKCTVRAGGTTFEAVRLANATVAVNDVVLLGTDTDAWWVIGKIATT